jgi:hypothetical protein
MIVSAGIVIEGIVIVTIARLHSLSALAPLVLLGGAAWVLFISFINALVQNISPPEINGRSK